MSDGILRVVATPIGNLDDLSPRAARALTEADVIACEDTRVTRKLLSRAPSRARLVSYHAANERSRAADLVRRIEGGDRVVLVTDAGTPGLSDPGQRLVSACLEAGLRVEVVPGPSAAVAALVVSGLPTARFVFEGFLPRTKGQRRRRLERLASEGRTLVMFEAPHRLEASLEDMVEILGDRPATLARELTKVHEEVLRSTIGGLLQRARDGVRGEVTLVVAGTDVSEHETDDDAIVERLRSLVAEGLSKRDAIGRTATELGVPKKRVYQLALDERL
jgi:16S rRNA (cytidine1402-2'-O)-methyltransferase